MDWSAYLSLAKELAEHDDSLSNYDQQARQRSAISRAYYAVFCTARDIFDSEHSNYPPSSEGSTHIRLWKQLKKDRDNPECRHIGEEGKRLAEFRRQADYDAVVVDLHTTMNDVLDSAEEMKAALERL